MPDDLVLDVLNMGFVTLCRSLFPMELALKFIINYWLKVTTSKDLFDGRRMAEFKNKEKSTY